MDLFDDPDDEVNILDKHAPFKTVRDSQSEEEPYPMDLKEN